MPSFKYKAINKNGLKTDGYIEAVTENDAVTVLGERGYTIISISEKSKRKGINEYIVALNRIKVKDVVIFSRQFAVLISANVTVVQSLKIIAEQTENPKFRKVVSDIADEVDGGERLSDAFEKRSYIFSQFFINVVRSGETSGKLDEILNYLADEMEKDYDLTAKVKGAMIYPAIVLVGMVAVGVIMMVFVIPKLTDVIKETGMTLPLSTRIVMGISDFLVAYWIYFTVAIIGAVVFARYYSKTNTGRRFFDFIKLKLPIFGNLLRKIYIIRFARSMETLLSGGVTVNKSLEIVSQIIENKIFEDLIMRTALEVEAGNPISSAFEDSKEVPPMVSHMMSIGEKTGKLDLVLNKIGDFYAREAANIVNNLMVLLEPIIMIILGVGVGIMVAAIIMPMYNMASQF